MSLGAIAAAATVIAGIAAAGEKIGKAVSAMSAAGKQIVTDTVDTIATIAGAPRKIGDAATGANRAQGSNNIKKVEVN